MAILEVKNIHKNFGEVQVLEGIDFSLEKGEVLAIIGSSGSGKTTLLRILIGLERADSGEIMKEGKDISSLKSIERGMGIVFQNYALFPNMTVLQNVEYALTLRKETKSTAREIATRTIEQVGLTDQMHKKPSQLSGGQQQRVAIARAIVMKPPLILADEPTGNLDPRSGKEILYLLENQHRQGVTLLVITHDMEIAAHADRVLEIENGTIHQMG